MTREEIMAMTAAQLRITVGELVMGYKWYNIGRGLNRLMNLDEVGKDYLIGCGWKEGKNSSLPDDCTSAPNYANDIAAAFEMEAEIERRGRKAMIDYGEALISTTVGEDWMGEGYYMVSFTLAHASPEQRCRAALLAVSEAK